MTEVTEKRRRSPEGGGQSLFGTLALVSAMIALVAAIVGAHVQFAPPPPKNSLKERLTHKAKGLLRQTLLGKEAAKTEQKIASWRTSMPRTLHMSSLALGVLALLLVAIAWVRNERKRFMEAAVALASVALLWHYLAVAIIVGVIVIVVGEFLA